MAGPNDKIQVDPIRVTVEGQTYSGWNSVSVTRPLDAATGRFSLKFNPTSSGFPLRPGQRVEVTVGASRRPAETIMTGVVDDLTADLSKNESSIEASGRDVTADLVDSSALSPEFFDLSLVELATKLCEPFGIEVVTRAERATTTRYDRFQASPGETAWNMIDRAARTAGVIAFTSGDGRMALESPGENFAEVQIEAGSKFANAERLRLNWNTVDRFNTYYVRAQSPGGDFSSGVLVSEIEGTATDAEIDRYRNLVVIAQGRMTPDDVTRLAQWEAIRRAARSATITATIPGLRQSSKQDAAIWSPNLQVRVRVPYLGLESVMLVNRVTFNADRVSGSNSVLELVRTDAYEPKPVVEGSDNPFDLLFDSLPIAGGGN